MSGYDNNIVLFQDQILLRQNGLPFMWHGIKQFACPDPQSVLNAENKKCAVFHNLENARKCSKLIKGLQKHNRNIAKNGDRDKDKKKRLIRLLLSPICMMLKIFCFMACPF